jgi:hypothetical protein
MLFPFSTVWVTVPVLAFGPSNFADVWGPPAAPANETLAAIIAASAKTDFQLFLCIALLPVG